MTRDKTLSRIQDSTKENVFGAAHGLLTLSLFFSAAVPGHDKKSYFQLLCCKKKLAIFHTSLQKKSSQLDKGGVARWWIKRYLQSCSLRFYSSVEKREIISFINPN